MIQPPTDSLYKFLAISGLLILGFSVFYPALRLEEFGKEHAQLNGDLRVLEFEEEQLKASTDPSAKAQAKIKRLQLQTKMEVILASLKQIRMLSKLLWGGFVVGFSLAILGFTSWYKNVQRYQDQILERQAKSPEHEPKEPSDVQQ